MIERFLEYIEMENLFAAGDSILLAVSGGADSVAMAEMFFRSGFIFGIAHCNFHLRGAESEGDEAFVKELAEKFKVRFHCRHFQTEEYSSEKGISIEMAARDLRYAWFNETMQSEGYNYIATAHHLGDEAETFFINLLRGTGISGLHGILPKQNRIIRPMLFTDKNEILEFLKENNLPFRHDASNDTLQYVRNKIRHTVIPQLSEINHSFLKNLKSTIEHLKDEEKIYKYFVEKKRAKVLMEKDGRIYISIKKLKKLKPLKTYLYEFLSPYGFNASVTNDVIRSLDEEPGKQFLSQTHKLIKDRQYLIIYDLRFSIYDLKETRECLIEKDTEKTGMPLRLEIKKAEVIKNFEVNKSAEYATLDYDRLEFPLLLRKWKHGDYFYPFGIGKKKKVSRLLIDKKLSIADKENVYVLCSGEKIAWVAGIRIDERFRITDKTKNAFVIRLIK